MICHNCNQTAPEGARHCPYCGVALHMQPQTVAEYAEPMSQPITQKPQPVYPEYQVPQEESAPPAPAKKYTGIILLIVAMIGIFLIGALALVGGLLFFRDGTDKAPNYTLYIKNDNLYYTDLSEDESVKITSNYGADISYWVEMSKDGTTLFYPKDYNGEEFDLYFCNVKEPESAEKLASGVTTYTLINDGKGLVYLKSNGKLYRHDLKEKEELAKEVTTLHEVSDDGEIIYYSCEDDEYAPGDYYVINGSEIEEVGKEVSNYSCSYDYKTILFQAEDAVYKKVLGSDTKKILSDIESVSFINDETEEIYFTRTMEDENDMGLMAFVDDDLAETDAAMTKPTVPEYPSYNGDYAAYVEAYEKYTADYKIYVENYYAYREKEVRDALREELRNAEDLSGSSIYYYNGSEETLICESGTICEHISYDLAIILYQAYDLSNTEKIKMSELYAYDSEDIITSRLSDCSSFYIADGADTTKLDDHNPSSFCTSFDSKTLYYLNYNEGAEDNLSLDKYGLYKLSIDGELGSPELIDDTVFRYELIGDNLYIMKNYDDETDHCDLFLNDELISKDVYAYGITSTDNGEIFVETDYDMDDYTYTLNRLVGTQLTEIADNVCNYTFENETLYLVTDPVDDEGTLRYLDGKKLVEVTDEFSFYDFYGYDLTPAGELLFLTDYNDGEGDLMLWDGDEAIKIESGISDFFFNYYYY